MKLRIPMTPRPQSPAKSRLLALAIALTAIVPKPGLSATDTQTWTASDGRVIQAKFIKLQGEAVVIEMNGRMFTVPFAKLAPDSVAQAKKAALAARPEAKRVAPAENSAIKVSVDLNRGGAIVSLGAGEVVENKAGVPIYPWYPDGHISVLPESDGSYSMFWAEFENYRTVGTSPFPEDHLKLEPRKPVLGGRGNWDKYNNGGTWLMSVFRREGISLLGFYHAEDHWYPHKDNNIAWKSIGVARSKDNGFSWVDDGQIITHSSAKPDKPVWGGVGDNCVVWDGTKHRWICFYQSHFIYMAMSEDPEGKPGSWHKWYEGDFSEPGLGGKETPIAGLKSCPGGNPSVHYNTHLKRWVMVWHGWDPPVIYIATSIDLIEWDEPKVLVESAVGGRAWYPTIIGVTDREAGKKARLYYADIEADFSARKFIGRDIEFSAGE